MSVAAAWSALQDHIAEWARDPVIACVGAHVCRWTPCVGGTDLEVCQSLRDIPLAYWMRTPDLWPGSKWGAKCRLGWQFLGCRSFPIICAKARQQPWLSVEVRPAPPQARAVRLAGDGALSVVAPHDTTPLELMLVFHSF